jgi:hypothetical protein
LQENPEQLYSLPFWRYFAPLQGSERGRQVPNFLIAQFPRLCWFGMFRRL